MRLGEILIERRVIQQEDLDRALELQRERGDKLGKILMDLGFAALSRALLLSVQPGHLWNAKPEDDRVRCQARHCLRGAGCRGRFK